MNYCSGLTFNDRGPRVPNGDERATADNDHLHPKNGMFVVFHTAQGTGDTGGRGGAW